MSPYPCLFRKLSLLSLLAVVMSCSEGTDAQAPSILDQPNTESATQQEIGLPPSTKDADDDDADPQTAATSDQLAAATESTSADQPIQDICSDSSADELVTSVAITTDLFYAFYAGSSFEDIYGNRFDFYNGIHSLQLTDNLSVTDFSVDSGDIKTLISSGELVETKVSDIAYIKFTFHTGLTFTSAQSDFFADLSTATQSELLEYEFKQLFDYLAGAFVLSVNGKDFYSSGDSSSFSYELSDMHGIMTHSVDAIKTIPDSDNLAQFEVTATITYEVGAAELLADTSSLAHPSPCTTATGESAEVTPEAPTVSDGVDGAAAELPTTEQNSADHARAATAADAAAAGSPAESSLAPVSTSPLKATLYDRGDMTLDEACNTPGSLVYCQQQDAPPSLDE